ncbi:MAG: hypothetical protein J7M27_02745 [Candidatus Latescibacteria bacterium]|nr:hypothetical protein [Candidatus Latescibacterota bacterium]
MRIGDFSRFAQSELRNLTSEIRCVVGQGNDMVGYVAEAEAFLRGGYKATLCGSRRLAPVVGDLLADCGGADGATASWGTNEAV